jgi:hypothetical protein
MEPLITPLLLASTGIDVPDDQVVPLLDYMNDLLEERIGETVAESLEDAQLEELATLQETASDEEIRAWIEAHVDSLPELIQDEVAIILGEAAQHRAEFSEQ